MATETVRVHGRETEIYLVEPGDMIRFTEQTKINLVLLHGMNAGNIQSVTQDDPVSDDFYDYYVRTPKDFVVIQAGIIDPLPKWSLRNDVYPVIAVPAGGDGTPITIAHQFGLAWGDMAGNFLTHDHFHGERGEVLTAQPRPELLHAIRATKDPYAGRNDNIKAYLDQAMDDALNAGRLTTRRVHNRLNPLVRKAEQALVALYAETAEIATELGIPEATFIRLKEQQERKKIDYMQRQEAILLGGEYEAPLKARVTHSGQFTP